MPAIPLFSIVIPTLKRADTLARALETASAQTDPDVEIVVQNNGADPETARLIEGIGDERVRHESTTSVLPMIDNWERALANARGEWIMILGDDDGLLPDACAAVRLIASHGEHELITWSPFLYLWPDYVGEGRENRLEATLDFSFRAQEEASGPLLRKFYAFETHYARLPMIYNSFVRRSLIERVLERFGRYFFGTQPDVTSGVINTALTPSFVRLSRPLSVAGLSRHSTGHNAWVGAAGPSEETVRRDFPKLGDASVTLPGARGSLEAWIASDMLQLKHELLADDDTIVIDHRRLVQTVAATANRDLDRYEDICAIAGGLAEHFDLDPDSIDLPPRESQPAGPPLGVTQLDGGTVRFVMDGAVVGLRTISDAVRLSTQLVPGTDVLEYAGGGLSDEGAPVLLDEPLSLAANTDGVSALVSGWGEPEPWGTWSVGPASTIRLAVPGGRAAVTLELDYRTIPLPDGGVRTVIWESGGRTWSLPADGSSGRLVFEVAPQPGTGIVELTLVHDPVISPAELGLSPDHRAISIGVEQISRADIVRAP